MYPCQRKQHRQRGISRRDFLGGVTAGTLAGAAGCGGPLGSDLINSRAQSSIKALSDQPGMPGPFPGRVVEVNHPGSVVTGVRDREAVKKMVEHGMQQLVPDAENAVDAWKFFFDKGDRVGIKVVPVGKHHKPGADSRLLEPLVDLKRPGSISSYEVVLEVIDALETAGVRLSDIMVFERYKNEFIHAGYREILPDGVHWECASTAYDQSQLEIDGQVRGAGRQKHIAGYDRDVFREMAFCHDADIHDPTDDRILRSHLTKIVTQKVDKVISIPVLKDHRSAGVTLCLKNMSHGLVNNVSRSHLNVNGGQGVNLSMNHCQTFIPAAVSLPPTREKCVLQILDGLVATYEGGPGMWNRTFATWERKSLFFSTDPVATDFVGWEIIDAKRAEHGWPAVARMGLDAQTGIKPDILGNDGQPFGEGFHIRQPQHIPLAGVLGMGVYDRDQIDHQRFEIA